MRCRDAGCLKHFLGNAFVHSQCTSKVTASCILNAKQIKGCLNLTILTVLAMQCHKYDIRCLTDFDHVWSKEAVRLIFSHCLYLCDIRSFSRNLCPFGTCLFRTLKNSCDIFLLIMVTHENIQHNYVMSFGAQCLTYHSSCIQGNIPLCAESAS